MSGAETTPPTADLQPDEILEELVWLKNLARRLVRDATAADDLVQDTVLTALQRSGGKPLPPRRWFASRLRSGASNMRRAERRRSVREKQGARREAQLSAGELVQRSEAQKDVLAALLKLPPEQHDALVMRFADGWTVTQIAKRQGCAKSTASQRIDRGLDALRRHLRGPGNEGAWAYCLLLAQWPTGVSPFDPPAGPTSLRLWSSVLVSKKLTLFVLVALALIVASDRLIRVAELGPTTANAAPDSLEAHSGLAEARSASETTVAIEPQRQPAESGRTTLASIDDYTLLGSVVDFDGTPLSGVSVRMLHGDLEHGHAWTQSDGTFELRLLPTELATLVGIDVLRVRVAAPGFEQRQFRFSDTEHADFPLPRGGSTDRVGCLRLPAATAIEGRVHDPEGRAIVGATVSLGTQDLDQASGMSSYSGPTGDLETQTDTEGWFELSGVPPGAYLVVAEHPEFEFEHDLVKVVCIVGERVRGVEIELRRASFLTGLVQDIAGQPIEGAYVAARSPRRTTVQSDAHGRFAVALRGGGPSKLEVFALGYELVRPSLDRKFTSADSELALILRAWEPTTVFQLLDTTSGGPVTLAACAVRPLEPYEKVPRFDVDHMGTPHARENGFVRSQATPGEDVLLVDAPGYVPQAVRVEHESSTPPHQIVELRPSAGIRGRLRSDGVSLRGRRIRLYDARFRLNEPRLHWSAGRFRVSDGPRMDMTSFGLTGWERKAVVGLDGMPPQYRTMPWSKVLAATRSDAAGRFFIDRAHESFGYLAVDDDEGTTARFLFEGAPTTLAQDLGDLDITQTATISGRVDLGGRPFDRALQVEVETLGHSTRVGASGEFRLEGVFPGDVYLDVDEVVHGGEPYFVREPSFHLRLAPGESREVVLPIANWITCRLESDVSAGGVPIPRGSMLEIRPAGSTRPFFRGPIAQTRGRIDDYLTSEGLCELQLHLPQTGAWPGKVSGGEILLDLQPGALIQRDLDFPVGRVAFRVSSPAGIDDSMLMDLELRPAGSDQAPQEIRHILFKAAAEDPTLLHCAALLVSPGTYDATLFRHDTTPRTAREDDEPLASGRLQLPMGGELTVTLE